MSADNHKVTYKGKVVMPTICPTDWMVPMAVSTGAESMALPSESWVVANCLTKPALAMILPFMPI